MTTLTLEQPNIELDLKLKNTYFEYPITLGVAPNEMKVKTYMPRFSTGTAEQWLRFVQSWNELITTVPQFTGVGAGPMQFINLRLLLHGDALKKFNRAANLLPNQGPRTIANAKTCVNAITRTKLGPRSARAVKLLIQTTKKPPHMAVSDYAHRLVDLNEYVSLLPAPNNALTDEDLRSALENGLPDHWVNTYLNSGQDIPEFDEFLDYVVTLEDAEEKKEEKKKKRANANANIPPATQPPIRPTFPSQEKSTKDKNNTKNTKFCTFHNSNSHDNSECFAQKKKPKEEAHYISEDNDEEAHFFQTNDSEEEFVY